MVASQERMESSSGVKVYVSVARGYDDIASDAIISDAYMMPIGFTIVFCYVMLMLGRFHWVETRAFLALAGCTSIGLTIVVCFGLCSAMGLFFSPMHNSIPFIMLGIGK